MKLTEEECRGLDEVAIVTSTLCRTLVRWMKGGEFLEERPEWDARLSHVVARFRIAARRLWNEDDQRHVDVA
jgi:hypothetical protein